VIGEWGLTFQGRPVKRGNQLLAYAERRKITIEDAVIELVNLALAQELHKRYDSQSLAAAMKQISDLCTERDHLKSQLAQLQLVDNLGPVRDAMATYEAVIKAGKHGGVAAAALVDALYAIVYPDRVAEMPVHVVCGVAESVERQRQQYAAGEGWLGDDETPERC
jgi:hypothetical protein